MCSDYLEVADTTYTIKQFPQQRAYFMLGSVTKNTQYILLL
jgi:hypothetical protein